MIWDNVFGLNFFGVVDWNESIVISCWIKFLVFYRCVLEYREVRLIVFKSGGGVRFSFIL